MLQGDHGPVGYCNIWVAPPVRIRSSRWTRDQGRQPQHRREQVKMLKNLATPGSGPAMREPGPLAEMIAELDKNNLQMFAVYTGINVDPDGQAYDPSLKRR